MTPNTIISEVREVIKDADATAYRSTDANLLTAVNRAMRRISLLRPDLFTTIGTITLVSGFTQTVPNYGRIVEVFGISAGNAVVEVNRETLDMLTPTWRVAAPVAPTSIVNWMRHSRNPSKFFVYPPSNGTGTLDAEYTVPPAGYAFADTLPISEIYQPAVVDMTAAEVEWADDENVLTQRADAFYKRAASMLTAAIQTQPLTDKETGQVPGAID
jgi:hypothetical protein